MAGIYKDFNGKQYTFDSFHKNKVSARVKAKVLRRRGYNVRVVKGSSSYKPYHGMMGWRVYKR